MKKHKHTPEYITPSQEEVIPLGEERVWRFAGLCFAHRDMLDRVACSECGMVGHRIKSRRGGFKWHTAATLEEARRTHAIASKFYDELGLPKPDALNKIRIA